jgi:hypothetical protein
MTIHPPLVRHLDLTPSTYRILTKKSKLIGEQMPLHDLIARLLKKDHKMLLCSVKAHPFFCGLDTASGVLMVYPI